MRGGEGRGFREWASAFASLGMSARNVKFRSKKAKVKRDNLPLDRRVSSNTGQLLFDTLHPFVCHLGEIVKVHLLIAGQVADEVGSEEWIGFALINSPGIFKTPAGICEGGGCLHLGRGFAGAAVAA